MIQNEWMMILNIEKDRSAYELLQTLTDTTMNWFAFTSEDRYWQNGDTVTESSLTWPFKFGFSLFISVYVARWKLN